VVVLFWFVLSLFGAIPLFLADQPWMTFSEAFFEAVSGLTTTGSTVITNLEAVPHSVLWYREQLHWLGGMGVIVLAVAVLPMLGVGGMQLFRAETPGPIKDDKLTPRINETAKALWLVYIGGTALCAMAYWLAGMNVFDAITQAFGTLATGGFSNYDDSLAHYHSNLILIVSIFFMWISGMNFALHFGALKSRRPALYLRDVEVRVYTIIMVVASLLIAMTLYWNNTYARFGNALLQGAFQVVSIMTSTGFVSANYPLWPSFVPIALMLIACIGGCAGSTAGGAKVVRVTLLFKQARREIMRMVHPSAELPVKMGENTVPPRVMEGVWAFFFIYVVSFGVMVLVLMAMGLSGLTAFSAIAASINNTGPGLGQVAANYSSIGAPAQWVLIFAMLWGRLEIFTLLVVLTPTFWRR
jgi:trk system potassium uptake protein TrkH